MNKKIRILSILCALAMLTAVLPVAAAEEGETVTQDVTVQDEVPVTEEAAAEDPAPAAEEIPAPAETTEQQPAPAAAEETQPAPAETAEEVPAPAETTEAQPAPAAAEEAQPAPAEAAEEVPAPAETTEAQPAPAAAEEAQPAPAATEEAQPAPAETVEDIPAPAETAEEMPAPAETAEEQSAPAAVEEAQPAPAETAEETPAPAETTEDIPAANEAAEENNAPAEAVEAQPADTTEEPRAPAETTEEPAAAEITEVETVPAEALAESAPAEAAEEQAAPAESEEAQSEPVELYVGRTVSGTVIAGEEYRITLKASKAETLLLTLTLNAGKKLDVKINNRNMKLTEAESAAAGKAVYTIEYDTAGRGDYAVTLAAGTDTQFTLKAESKPEPAAEEVPEETPAEEEAAEETAAETPAEEETAEETAGETPACEEAAAEEPAEEAEEEPAADPDQAMLDNGYVKVMVIRENGTNLYNANSADAEAVSALEHGSVAWIKAAGGMWGEVYAEQESRPLYLNLNNVVLLAGEVGYDIPIRKVRLSSTLDGLTEVTEGTEITITAEFSGFMEDEIAEVSWQYRTEDDQEGVYLDIAEAHDFVYTYFVSAENVHNEWRIVLTLKS